MPATQFDGANDNIVCSTGGLAATFPTTGVTLVSVMKLGVGTNNQWQAIGPCVRQNSTTTRYGLERDNGNGLAVGNDSLTVTGNVVDTTTGWAMVVSSHTSGGVPDLCYASLAGTPTWNDDTGSSGLTIATSAIQDIIFGEWGPSTDDFTGWIACAAVFQGKLTLSQIHELTLNKRTSDIWNCSFGRPIALWEFNKTGVKDLTGRGANETGRSGTTIDNSAGEPWTYDGLGTLPVFLGSSTPNLSQTTYTVTTTGVGAVGPTKIFARIDWASSGTIGVSGVTGGGLTWTRVGGVEGAESSGRTGIDVWAADVPAGATVAVGTVITFTMTGSPYSADVQAWHQMNATSVDGAPAGTVRSGPTTTVTSPAVSVAGTDDTLYFMTFADGPAGSTGPGFSVTAPWSEPWPEVKNTANDWTSGMAVRSTTTASSYSGTGTWSTGPTFADIGLLIAIKNAGSITGPANTGIGLGAVGGGTIGVRASASGPAVLSGSMPGTGAASGALTAAPKLVGSSAGTGAASGALRAQPQLSGSAAGTGLATGGLTAFSQLVGSSLGSGLATGFLTAAPKLVAASTGAGLASGALTAAALLSGSAAGTGSMTGVITVPTVPMLVGSMAGAGLATGALTATSLLTGSAPGTGASSGALTASPRLTGSSVGAGAASGALTAIPRLTGSATGSGAASGQLTAAALLAGSSAGTGAATGAATASPRLTGSTSGQGDATGAPTAAPKLAGSAAGTGASTGVLSVPPPVGSLYSEILVDAPLGYWRKLSAMTGVGPLSMGIFDESGNGNDLEAWNAGTVPNNAYPQAASSLIASDPSDAAWVQVPNSNVWANAPAWSNLTTEVSLECWLRANSFPGVGQNHDIVRKANVYALYTDTLNRIVARVENGAGVPISVVGPVLNTAQTYHVAMTYDGANVKLYLDKVLIGTSASGTTGIYGATFANFAVGQYGGSTEAWDGTFDEIALYDHALTAARVAAHYDAGTGAAPTYVEEVQADAPVAYWRMDANSSTQPEDQGGPDLVLNGATPNVAGATTALGPAVSFDGIDDYGRTASTIDLSGTDKACFECWLLWDTYDDNDSLALEHGESNRAKGLTLNPDSSNLYAGGWSAFSPDSAGNNFYEKQGSRPTAGTWHHVVINWDRGATLPADQIVVYLDGALKIMNGANTQDLTGNNADLVLMVMARSAISNGAKSLFAGGDMQHLAVYDHVLSPTRIAAHYNARNATGGFGASLGGSMAGAGAASGLLSAATRISGAGQGTGAASGALSAPSLMSGASQGQGALSGALRASPQLAGSAAGTGSITGALTAFSQLVGSSAGTGSFAGALTAAPKLAGSGAGAGSMSGILTASPQLVGSASGVASFTGVLSAIPKLAGAMAGTGAMSGSLSVPGAANFAGAANGSGAMTGGLAVIARLVGAAPGTGLASGLLSAPPRLAGSAPGTGAMTGQATVPQRIAGSSAGAGAASGALSSPPQLAGSAPGTSGASGALRAAPQLIGAASGQGNLIGALRATSLLAGSSGGQGDASGLLSAPTWILGSAVGTGSMTGALVTGQTHWDPLVGGGFSWRYPDGRLVVPGDGRAQGDLDPARPDGRIVRAPDGAVS